MGETGGFKRTDGPRAGEWFLNAYYYSFDATGNDLVDELLSALARAGKCHHHTESWLDPTGDDGTGPSHIDAIQLSAERIAAELARPTAERDAEIERLRKELGDAQGMLTAAEQHIAIQRHQIREQPTLAEVAMHLASGMLTNPINDRMPLEDFTRGVVTCAEALLAELKRREG